MPSSKNSASRPNSQSPHEDHADSEKWKTSPSTETTSDEGENAETEAERKIEENAPHVRKPRE